ncbi:MAG: C4-dicarboxylate ABC transporter, partial [Proteobacteria bacterium]|nr:C4-dicarboxylate ABC transporter [Pseudomonadota bacterium]
MNRARYDSLPAELKRVIDANSGAEASAWVGKVFDAARAAGRKSAVEQGNQIHVIVPQDMKSWFDAGDR